MEQNTNTTTDGKGRSLKRLVSLLALCALTGCYKSETPAVTRKMVTMTDFAGTTGGLGTVEHDGHLWVVRNHEASPPVHHPDCHCMKQANNEAQRTAPQNGGVK